MLYTRWLCRALERNYHLGPILPVPVGSHRPTWSVMIPTYNRSKYLAQALESVLSQGFGSNDMQIEVVDNSSTQGDSEKVVHTIAPQRVSFYRQPQSVPISANWNTCIERARGHLVHILHDDDFVSEKFYHEMNEIAGRHTDCAFLASRSFFVDEDGMISGVSPRLPQMEQPTHSIEPMLRTQLFQTPGVVIRRSFYERFGGFALRLVYCADWEMWVRAVRFGGGVVHAQPLASYRLYGANDSGRLARSAENVRDVLRLESFFCGYPGFSRGALRDLAAEWALVQLRRFLVEGDLQAARANAEFYAEVVPLWERLARRMLNGAWKVVRGISSGIFS